MAEEQLTPNAVPVEATSAPEIPAQPDAMERPEGTEPARGIPDR